MLAESRPRRCRTLGGSGVPERCPGIPMRGGHATPWCPMPTFAEGLGGFSPYSSPQGGKTPAQLLPSPWCSTPDLAGSHGHPLFVPPCPPHQVVSLPLPPLTFPLSFLSWTSICLPKFLPSSRLPSVIPLHSHSPRCPCSLPSQHPLATGHRPPRFTSPLSLPRLECERSISAPCEVR